MDENENKKESLFKKTYDLIDTLEGKEKQLEDGKTKTYKDLWYKLTPLQKTRAIAMVAWYEAPDLVTAIDKTMAEDYKDTYRNVGKSFEAGLNYMLYFWGVDADNSIKKFFGINPNNEEIDENVENHIKGKVREKINNGNMYDMVLEALKVVHYQWILDSTLKDTSKIADMSRMHKMYQMIPFELLCNDEADADLTFLESNLIFIEQILNAVGIKFSREDFLKEFHRRKVEYMAKYDIVDEKSLERHIREKVPEYLDRTQNDLSKHCVLDDDELKGDCYLSSDSGYDSRKIGEALEENIAIRDYEPLCVDLKDAKTEGEKKKAKEEAKAKAEAEGKIVVEKNGKYYILKGQINILDVVVPQAVNQITNKGNTKIFDEVKEKVDEEIKQMFARANGIDPQGKDIWQVKLEAAVKYAKEHSCEKAKLKHQLQCIKKQDDTQAYTDDEINNMIQIYYNPVQLHHLEPEKE